MKKLIAMILIVGVSVWGLVGSIALAQGNQRGLDPKNFDTTVSPCTDFYQYADGTWLKNNPVPAAYASWSVDNEMRDRNETLLKQILESSSADTKAPKGSNAQKIGDFYFAAMDTVDIEKSGTAPIKGELDRIAAIKTISDLQSTIMTFHKDGISSLFDCSSEQDMKNNTAVIAYATQGGLGLPDRDYYTKTDDESKALRGKYVAHVAAMFKLLGDAPDAAATEAQAVMNIETKLAEASLTNVELRDPNAYYNIMTVKDADKATPNFSWSVYFKTFDHPEIEKFSYAHPKFFARMDSLLTQVSLADWKSYLRWHVVHEYASYMSSAFVNESFQFYGTTLAGTKELRPRWKRALGTVNRQMGEALGQLYVKQAFPPAYKARALEMIENLRAALGERIKNLSWMSDATKQMALKKLATFTPKVGYPDKWRDYSSLEIDRSSYVANVRRAQAFEVKRNWNKIGKPVDRTEWGMSPQTINAYYNPLLNEICFPAAILQPPLFDGEADDALNYGATGATIGHEMTHGFDDEGSQFDAEGNLKNWWTDADRKEFEARAQKLVEQYNGYVVVDSAHINGKLTLGENIGDLGGLLVAYDALERALAGKERKPIDGFTPEQRFFLSFAQEWRTNQRPEAQKLQVNTDPHSPAKFRCNGTVSNMPAFYKAFGCKTGDALIRNDTAMVKIW